MSPTPRPRCHALLALALMLGGCLPLDLGRQAPELPDPPPGPYREAVRALRGLAGTWEGELVLRDDASRTLATVPVRVVNEIARDGVHVISHRQLTRGGSVHLATDITAVDARTGQLLTAAFEGRTHRDRRYRIRSFDAIDPYNWTLVADAPPRAGERHADAGAEPTGSAPPGRPGRVPAGAAGEPVAHAAAAAGVPATASPARGEAGLTGAPARVTLTRGGNHLSWRRDERGEGGEYTVRSLVTLDRETP